jgi:hypothetical protein
MTRISWERLAALAGLAFVVLYVLAFALGIEVGDSDREIRDYYADSGNRDKEVVAFFLIASAALSLAVFATALRSIIMRFEQESAMLAALAWAGGIGCAALILAGNAVSRATAFAASDEGFQLNVDTRDLSMPLASCSSSAGHLRRFSSSSASHSRRWVTASSRAGSCGLRGGGTSATRNRVRRIPCLLALGYRHERRPRP